MRLSSFCRWFCGRAIRLVCSTLASLALSCAGPVSFGSPGTAAGKQSQAFLGKWALANARVFALQRIFAYLAWTTGAGIILVPLIRMPAKSESNPLTSE
jgi:hypothetical protein